MHLPHKYSVPMAIILLFTLAISLNVAQASGVADVDQQIETAQEKPLKRAKRNRVKAGGMLGILLALKAMKKGCKSKGENANCK